MTDQTIEARAAQRAKAREHCIGCERNWKTPHNRKNCTVDHRTPAEQREAAMDALAAVWAYLPALDYIGMDERLIRNSVLQVFEYIQRTEVPYE